MIYLLLNYEDAQPNDQKQYLRLLFLPGFRNELFALVFDVKCNAHNSYIRNRCQDKNNKGKENTIK